MGDEEDVSFQFLAENSTDVICRAGPDMVLHYVSPSSFHILGWKPQEMVGKKPHDFIVSQTSSFHPDSLGSSLEETPITLRMRRKDGTIAWMETKQRLLRDAVGGKPSETIIVMRDITERKTLEEQLSLLELTDVRTGLATHRGFDEALEREWNRTLREGNPISLLLLDFNHFRQFHDWRFHREGDHCLAKAAAAVIGAVRVTDLAARYGAEEIAVILPSTGPGGAVKVAEKVQAAIHELRSSPTGAGTREGWLTVSIGIATASARPGATARMPEILRLGADNALRKAKNHRIPWPARHLAAPAALAEERSAQGTTDTP
jgi:diguanylate cyclase (GGDEF)-like protein/PAS domain S-box-containing protein